VLAVDKLFATLDPTTRLVQLSSGVQMLMTDTVGFIRKLPPHLVASFKSTLEEITEADLLIHIVDVTSKRFEEQIQIVKDTLEEIGVHDKPTLMVFNKIDLLAERSMLHGLTEQYPKCVFISAARGINISGLLQEILRLLESEFVEEQLRISQAQQKLISYLHSVGEVLDTAYEDNSVLLKLRLPKKDRGRVLQMVSNQQKALTKESA
ncbi:MAG TPA: GTPase, partial [Bacteroidota bacterium]